MSGLIFTAEHCGASTSRLVDNQVVTRQGGSVGADSAWFSTAASLSSTVTTTGGDVAVAGVLQPWQGLTIFKSGRISGVSSGTLGSVNSSSYSYVTGMRQCEGDSGSVAYAYIGGAAYVVGMVTNGNGSEGDTDPGQVCSPTPPSPLFGGVRDIDQMCAAANLSACRNEAGKAFGGFDSASGVPGGVAVAGWAFDANSPASSLTITTTIDGTAGPALTTGAPRGDITSNYQLPSGAAPGFNTAIPATSGAHTVCLTATNIGYGANQLLGCANVVTPPPNVTNGSFDGGLSGWAVSAPSSAGTAVYSTGGQDGNNFGAVNASAAGVSIYQDVVQVVTSGSAYTASIWVRAQDVPAGGAFCLYSLAGQGSCLSYAVDSGSWRRLEVVLNPTQSASALRIQLWPTANNGTTLFDTASLEP